MKTILEELFDGNIYPDELIISRDPEYYPLNKKISGTMEMWKNKLSEDDFKELENLLHRSVILDISLLMYPLMR